jgi:hypothetical protein
VGTWEWEWRAKDDVQFPDGTLIDFGTIQWHEDGTEITISGGRTPAVGDVCMGSWRQVGHSKFRLTHVAMGYGPPPGPATGYGGLAVLDMTVTVDRRMIPAAALTDAHRIAGVDGPEPCRRRQVGRISCGGARRCEARANA